MTTKSNLRFLLALGNKKVIVLKNAESVNIYSNCNPLQEKNRVAIERISNAITVK